MLIDLVLGSKAVWRILSMLAEAPGQGITKEEIRQITKLGGNSLFRSMEILKKSEIVNVRKVGKRSYYSLNLSNKYSGYLKDIVQLEEKELNNMDKGIVVILREFVRKVLDILIFEDAYVFGSIVKNSYNEKSDVDVAFVLIDKPSQKEKIEVEKITEHLEKRFKREIEAHYFTKQDFNVKNKLAEQVQRDGIKLI